MKCQIEPTSGKDISVLVSSRMDWEKPLRSVLCVDDDEDCCEVLAQTLIASLPQVVVFKSLKPAIALKLADSLFIDCLVSDMDMPGMFGDKFINAFKEKSHCTYVMAITGAGAEVGFLAGRCKADCLKKKTAGFVDDVVKVVNLGFEYSQGCIASRCHENYDPDTDSFSSANWRHAKDFKEFTGYAPKEYEMARRRLKAVALISAGAKEKVYYQVGFQSKVKMMADLNGVLDVLDIHW